MSKFLTFLALFLIPIFLFIGALEFLVHTIPNSYSYKYNYILKNGKHIQTLAMGHSQLYDGFKAESFKIPSFNLSNSAQSFKEDYYLLKDLIPRMTNLKCVILPIGYMNVIDTDVSNEQWSERSIFYHEYMNLDYDNHLPLKYRFECLHPGRAFEKVTSYYIHHIDIIGCDSLGRRSTHNLINRLHDLGYDKVLYDYTLNTHNKSKMHIQVGIYLERIASLLKEKNIKLVLVSPPHFWACFKDINLEQKTFLQDYVNSLKRKYNFQYINLEDDIRFEDQDFYNETHLSEFGAEKFTRILNDSIQLE